MKKLAKKAWARYLATALYYISGLLVVACAFSRFYIPVVNWEKTLMLWAGAGLLLLLTVVFLMQTVLLEEREKPRLRERIPLDLYLALLAALSLLTVTIAVEVYYILSFRVHLGFDYYFNEMGFSVGLMTAASCFLLLNLTRTLAIRIKDGKFWRNTLIYRLWRWFYARLTGNILPFCTDQAAPRLGKLPGLLVSFLRNRLFPAVYRLFTFLGNALHRFFALLFREPLTILGGGLLFDVYVIVSAILFYNGALIEPEWLMIWLLLQLAVFICIANACIGLRALFTCAKKIAAGNLSHQIDTKHMLPPLKKHGQCLNRIGEGLSLAVEEKLRSERLKTELITNVSHDIKTPLTSIVSYVDLLKKESSPNPAVHDYLDALDRATQRLKKLTEDLVEASKASTGNLSVSLAPTGAAEIINQSLGEYSDRLSARGLDIIPHLPEQDVAVLADGRHLWRVLDNLLSNIVKYAQENTRLYIDVCPVGRQVEISFKNISQTQLNISPNELMERFVRGDSARTTEGSGLGLSIAQSLMELMGGAFAITIDGDLFKTQLTLPAATFEKSL